MKVKVFNSESKKKNIKDFKICTDCSKEIFDYGLYCGELSNKVQALEEEVEELRFRKIYDYNIKDESKDKLEKTFFIYPLSKLKELNFVSVFGRENVPFKSILISETDTKKHSPRMPLDGIEIKYSDAKKIIKFLQEYIEDVDKEFEKKMENDNG